MKGERSSLRKMKSAVKAAAWFPLWTYPGKDEAITNAESWLIIHRGGGWTIPAMYSRRCEKLYRLILRGTQRWACRAKAEMMTGARMVIKVTLRDCLRSTSLQQVIAICHCRAQEQWRSASPRPQCLIAPLRTLSPPFFKPRKCPPSWM